MGVILDFRAMLSVFQIPLNPPQIGFSEKFGPISPKVEVVGNFFAVKIVHSDLSVQIRGHRGLYDQY